MGRNRGGMGGMGGGGMDKMMEQVKQMQQKMADDLAAMSIEGSAGGGAVVVTLTGQKELKSIVISKEAVDPEDVETLQDLILLAFNEAMGKADAAAGEQASGFAKAMGLPPGMGF